MRHHVLALLIGVSGWGCDDEETVDAQVDSGGADATLDGGREDSGPDAQVLDALLPDALLPDALLPDALLPDALLPDAHADGAPDVPHDAGPEADAARPDEWFACNAPADCVVFEAECCDHCNDGRAVAVNRAHLEAARAAMQASDCEDVACTGRGCAPAAPTCVQGTCGWVPDPAWGDPCHALDEAACGESADCRPILGAPAAELCIDDFANWMSIFAGCLRADLGCGAAETCAIRPGDGRRLIFPDTCTPFGWAPCDPCALGECARGFDQAPARLCVRGEPEGGMERLEAGRVTLEVWPRGCHSSSCTRRLDIACGVDEALAVEARFCIADVPGAEACTDDCGGAGTATCYAPAVPEGRHTFTLGERSVTVDVPSMIPRGGACEGQPFE